MKILVINGPNINMLGVREPEIYGCDTYEDLVEQTRAKAREISEKNYDEGREMVKVNFIQSNHEGEIVTAIQKTYGMYDGIVINPAAYTHTSIAILDALKAVGIPAVEVHISDLSAREEWRQISYIRDYCIATVSGEGIAGYSHAIEILVENIGKK